MQKRIITYLIFSLILFPLGAQKIFVRGYALDDEIKETNKLIVSWFCNKASRKAEG